MTRRRREPHPYPDTGWTWPLWAALLLTLAPVFLSSPMRARAQAEPVVLTVRCRTVADAPVPGVAVTVIDAPSDVVLAEGTTDGAGLVRFHDMPPAELRVRLAGSLPGGTALRHTRQDQGGIWVNLPTRDWVMDLRVDEDGLIFPDLGLGNAGAPDAAAATAIAEGTLPTIAPTTRLVTTVPRTMLSPLPVVQPPAPAPQTDVSGASSLPTAQGAGMALLLLLLGMIGGVIWFGIRSTP